MSCYVIAHIEVTDRTQYMQYAEAAGAQIEAAGGRVLAAGPAAMLEGEPFPNHNVVLEFPASEAVDAWYHSDGYQAAIPVRLRSAATSQLAIVPGGIRVTAGAATE